jgi:hypothetical protein
MPHLRLLRLALAQPAASRGAKLSCREKRWAPRVVEHSVLASTIVSLEFLYLSATRIRFGRFLVGRPKTPFLLDRFSGRPHVSEKSLARTRVPYRNSWLRTFVSGTNGIGGVCVKPFSCARDLVERRARLSLDSLYVDHVRVSELTQPVSQRKNVVGHSRTVEVWFFLT